jgi:diadenylate cyclase
LLVATTEELQKIEGIGETRARSIRNGLSKITEAALLERLL